jgi:hypothetical protein
MIWLRKGSTPVALNSGSVHLIYSDTEESAVTGLRETVAELHEPAESPPTCAAVLLVPAPAELFFWAAHGGATRREFIEVASDFCEQLVSIVVTGPAHCETCRYEQLNVMLGALIVAQERLVRAYHAAQGGADPCN